MSKEKLFLNTLTFEYPNKPVKLYFSGVDDAGRRSVMLKSSVLIPKEVKAIPKYANLLPMLNNGKPIFTSFDKPLEGFEAVDIDFHDPENENLVKRYYNYRLEKYFHFYDDGVVVTKSGITNDLQVWIQDKEYAERVSYLGKSYGIFQMDRYTLKVRFDHFNKRPYLLVACDRPALVLNMPIADIFADAPADMLTDEAIITPRMINKVMTREEKKNKEEKVYIVRKVDNYEYLQSHNRYCPLDSTRPVMGKELKRFFGMEHKEATRSFDSKYVKYYEKIEDFRQTYLNNKDVEAIFRNIAYGFTPLEASQIGIVDIAKRRLLFGNSQVHTRQQVGVNYGPCIKCPYIDVQLIFIFPEQNKSVAQNLLRYMIRNREYRNVSKSLSEYIGTPVNFAQRDFHVIFENETNPIPEIDEVLKRDCYRNKDPKVKYVGIYISPIHKYASAQTAKECYYKIKERFLRNGIPTQCIDRDKMLSLMASDEKSNKSNFTYTLQNMGVAICAKLGGSPWLLAETAKKELVIGIGAFKSDAKQYLGTAFSFDNTGTFNDYQYFQKDEIDELVGAMQYAIIKYSNINNKPERLIVHYFKKMSHKNEFKKIENMLNNLKLDIPVYVVTINKTESEDIVVLDGESTYQTRNYQTKAKETAWSLMPYSGRYVNLGRDKAGHRFLLCNNTRYENEDFNKMDGFPFPIKLNIACPNRESDIETNMIQELIGQVYQFSRIYWKSVKQQGLPVTIKYPEMIAEIMPHFESPTIYPDSKSLWFL